MEKFLWPVHSARGQMLASYERIRLRNFADAFRDLSYHILKPEHLKFNYFQENDETEEIEPTLRICEHIGQESLRHLGERMKDAADLFEAVSQEQCRFEAPEILLRRNLECRFKKVGFELYDILVIERENQYREFLLSVRSSSGKLMETEDAAKILSDCFREKIRPAMCCPIFVSGEFNEYLFCSAGRFRILEGYAGVSKEGEKCSGDSYSFFRQGNRFVCMLSDGTGVGEQARKDSGHLLDLAENYLESGFAGNQMLGFLEGMMMDFFLENRVPSLDYVEINQTSGEMKMAKFGSAISYLWHDSRLSLLEPGNLLLGYEKLSDTIWLEPTLQNNDLLILMSDGVAERITEVLTEEDFAERLQNGYPPSPSALAKELLEMAVELDDGSPHDDMTVLVLQMSYNGVK